MCACVRNINTNFATKFNAAKFETQCMKNYCVHLFSECKVIKAG